MPKAIFRAALLVSCAAASWMAAPAGAITLKPCDRVTQFGAQCGRVIVPLDRSGTIPGSVGLRVAEYRPGLSLSPGSGSGVVLLLTDLSEPSTDALGGGDSFDFTTNLNPLVGDGRLVAFDRRGTGGSGPIACRALARMGDPVQTAADCAAELGPARASYTLSESVADAEAVRAALRIKHMTIFATGEGARLALAYAGAYPQHVDRLVLDSPVAPEGADPLRRSAFVAARGVVRALCLRTCRFARNPGAEWSQLVQRATVAPLAGAVVDAHGRSRPLAIGPSELAGLLLAGTPDGWVWTFLPAAVHAALAGDLAPLSRLVDEPGGARELDAAVLASACEDGSLPWTQATPAPARQAAFDAALAAIPPSVLAPFGAGTARAFGTAEPCIGWPESPIGRGPLPLPHLPTLILAGELDLQTPAADTAVLARRIPGAQLLRVPQFGHDVLAASSDFDAGYLLGCAPAALEAFVHGRQVKPCPHRSTIYTGRPLPLRGAAAGSSVPPRSLAAVRPQGRKLPPRVGRTLAAVRATMYDIVQQASARGWEQARFGGLRAGFAVFRRGVMRAHGYEYVPGVAVTLVYGGRGSFLRIGGSAAVHGRLGAVRNCGESACFTGRLAGHRVQVTIPGTA